MNKLTEPRLPRFIGNVPESHSGFVTQAANETKLTIWWTGDESQTPPPPGQVKVYSAPGIEAGPFWKRYSELVEAAS